MMWLGKCVLSAIEVWFGVEVQSFPLSRKSALFPKTITTWPIYLTAHIATCGRPATLARGFRIIYDIMQKVNVSPLRR